MTTFQRQVSTVSRAVVIAVALMAHNATAQEIHGAGSTFVAPVMFKWAAHYARSGGGAVNYQSVGSGAGIQQIEAGAVDFGATDKPLEPAEVRRLGLCQFPIVIGTIVPVVNLPGISQGQMKFSGRLLADIFMGKVKQWDDPAIRAPNAGVGLPHLPITVVHRLDGSGTTYNWVNFLARSSDEWNKKLGVGLTVNWPTGVAGKGNEGVAADVGQIAGAIGYVEFAYVWRDHLTYGQVQNGWGIFVEPTVTSFEVNAANILGANAATLDWQHEPNFNALTVNVGGAAGYPVVAATFILMPQTPKDPARSAATLAFFKWALEHGEQDAADLNYLPLPANLVLLTKRLWASHINGAPRS